MFSNPFRIFTFLTLGLYSAYGAFVNHGFPHVEELVRTNNLRFSRAEPLVPKCFSCKDCNTIAYNAETINCPSPGSCYAALASEDEFYEVAAVRGCITKTTKASEPTEDPCNDAKIQYMRNNPKGVFKNCRTCSSSSIGPCNGDPFQIKGTAPVICYKCNHCDHVKHNTTSIICPVDECCYRVELKDYPHGAYYTVRGCKRLAVGQTCDRTCEYVKERYSKKQPTGSLHCIQCRKGDSNNCNYFQFNRN